jgi:hypothetical protein
MLAAFEDELEKISGMQSMFQPVTSAVQRGVQAVGRTARNVAASIRPMSSAERARKLKRQQSWEDALRPLDKIHRGRVYQTKVSSAKFPKPMDPRQVQAFRETLKQTMNLPPGRRAVPLTKKTQRQILGERVMKKFPSKRGLPLGAKVD